MASPVSAGENGSGDGADAASDAFRVFAQGLAQLQEALRLEKQEVERKVQEAERRTQEALRLQEERVATALREMERKLQEKDDAIRALQQRLEETQGRGTAVEGKTTAAEGSGGEGGGLQRLESRVEKIEASLQSVVQKFLPRVEALLRQLEEPQSTVVSRATAAGTREAPAAGGAATGGGGQPASCTPTPTSPVAAHQGAAVDEDDRERKVVQHRVREAKLRMERARSFPCPLGEQLCQAAGERRLNDAHALLNSGADVNYTGRGGLTPLLHAAWDFHVDMVWLLLQRNSNANAIAGENGSSALHLAAADSTGKCVQLLVGAGADVNARDVDGDTPLHRAAYFRNEEGVRALLVAGARRDLRAWGGFWKNQTPFDVARSPAVRKLLRGYVDSTIEG